MLDWGYELSYPIIFVSSVLCSVLKVGFAITLFEIYK